MVRITTSQKYASLRSVLKSTSNNDTYEDKKQRLIKELPTLCRNRNIFSRIGPGNRIPDSLQNSVVALFKSNPANIDTTPTEKQCVDLLRNLVSQCFDTLRNNDVRQIERMINNVGDEATTLFYKVLSQSKGLCAGKAYRNLDYIKHPEKNSKSKYNALLHQSNEIKRAIKTFEILEQIETGATFPEAKVLLNKALSKVEDNKNGEDIDQIATKRDWSARLESNEKVTTYVERLLNSCKNIPQFSQAIKDFTDSSKIDKAIKEIKTKAYIVTQQELLRETTIKSEVKLNSHTTMISTQTANSTMPSIIRGKRHIFQPLAPDSKLVKKMNKLINKFNTSSGTEKNRLQNQINELETKIRSINALRNKTNYGLNNSMGINVSTHTISFVNSAENSSSAIKLDRCGHIDTPEAADDYVKRMSEANKGSLLSENGKILLIDNRLMYDTTLPKGEAKLIRKHQRFIDDAIVRYNKGKPLEQQLAIVHLNLPSKTYLGMNKQNTQSNRAAFVRILEALRNSTDHHKLLDSDQSYKMFFNFMDMHKEAENYFCGENGHKMAFAMKILCNKSKGIPSGGCKSAKDRDGAQKVFDEVYSALLHLKDDGFENPDEFFDNIPEKYLPTLQNVVIQNGISDITRLNTSFPGSKNFSALIPLLNSLGFKDRSAFKGQSSNAKG